MAGQPHLSGEWRLAWSDLRDGRDRCAAGGPDVLAGLGDRRATRHRPGHLGNVRLQRAASAAQLHALPRAPGCPRTRLRIPTPRRPDPAGARLALVVHRSDAGRTAVAQSEIRPGLGVPGAPDSRGDLALRSTVPGRVCYVAIAE